jgi:methyltransferase (TIGR00027 family)
MADDDGLLERGGASVTAQRVAAHRLGCDRAHFDGGAPAADDALARDVAGGVPTDPERPMGRYLTARTAFFDRVVLGAVSAGMPQVVVAAAGYDGRAWRYGRPGTRWFEVDHPSTQADKLARIDRLGLPADAATYVAADFTTTDVAAALGAAGHRDDLPTLFLCEGIAVYLDPDVLTSLLTSLRSRAAPGSRLAISMSVDTGDAELADRRRRFEDSVGRLGESARNSLTPDAAAGLFSQAGWAEPDVDERRARARLGGLVLLEPGAPQRVYR